jgi:hypothetical protein
MPPEVAPQAAPQPVSQPQSNDEAISTYARGLLNEIDQETPTNALDPNPREAPVEEAQPTETEAEATEEQEAETPPPEPEEPTVEVEVEGKKATVPEWVKHRMMADKDYRQKTMEVSAKSKSLEQLIATATQTAQQAQQLAPYHAQLSVMDNRAQYLDQQLRSGALNSDPLEFNRVQGELAVLLHQKTQFANGLQTHVQQLTAQQQKLRADQLALDAPKLFQEFPEIAKPETQQKLAKYVMDEGLPQEAIDFLNYSAAGTKLAWKAHQYDVMVKDQAAAQAKLKEKVKGLPSASQSSRAADKGAKDQQLRRDWQKGGGKIHDPAFSALLRSKIQ